MTKSELLQLLTEYTPLEKSLKNKYIQNGGSITDKELAHLLRKYERIPTNLIQEFQSVPPESFLPISAYPPPGRQFSEAGWFTENEDISIHKHPRYSPASRHTHSFIEIAYVAEGSCRQDFYYPSGQVETLLLPKGSLCILPPKLEHAVFVFDDSIMINILIRTSAMKHTLTDLVAGSHVLFDFFLYTLYENTTPNYLLFHTGPDETIHDLILDMINESCGQKQYSQKALLLMLGLFFTYLQRDYSDWMQFSQVTSAGISYIPQILNYIQHTYDTASVEDIASHFAVSTSYLGRIFKENTHTTVLGVIQQTRVQKACELLISTRLLVQDIAEAVGYQDVTYFIRMFKKQIGLTPLQFRKTHRKTLY